MKWYGAKECPETNALPYIAFPPHPRPNANANLQNPFEAFLPHPHRPPHAHAPAQMPGIPNMAPQEPIEIFALDERQRQLRTDEELARNMGRVGWRVG